MHIPPPFIMLLAIIGIYYGRGGVPVLSFGFAGQQFLAICITALGAAIAIVSVLRFRKSKTTVLPNKLDEATHLVTGGVYNYSRNPMYLGMAILIIASGIYLGSFLFLPLLALFVLIINKIQIEPEEAALEKIFGQEYLDFKSRVRRWI